MAPHIPSHSPVGTGARTILGEDTQQQPTPYYVDDRVRLYLGDSRQLLLQIPDAIDCCITSPPYWQARNYGSDGQLGHERDPDEYVDKLVAILGELRTVLKPRGSMWLNIGDAYRNKNLQGIPWKTAFALQRQGWILRNDVIWHKKKHVPSNARDRLALAHEHLFHFVLESEHYYDMDAIREQPGTPVVKNGRVITPTGVSGVKYRRQINESRVLTEAQKQGALRALEMVIEKVRVGELPDFRMLIKGSQRVVHGGDIDFSGRAKEVEEKGFAVLPYHPRGSAPTDVWSIQPEDEIFPEAHFAVYPEELCVRPILATCPPGGIVLDPFVGAGTTLVVARRFGRYGIGIDLSKDYIDFTIQRLMRQGEALQGRLPLD